MKSYATYRAIDFARDEYFQQWVLRSDAKASIFWLRWLAGHPWKQSEVEEARRLLLTLGQAEEPIGDERATRMRRGILERLSPALPPAKLRRRPGRGWVAACLLALLLAAGSFWGHQRWAYVSYATPYGEKQIFALPDGSEVTLKANSRLRYRRDWSVDQEREVWLSGEAFFHVKKQVRRDQNGLRSAAFVVHATEAVDVAVLGTEFNVSTRGQETEVVLKSGSVRVEVKDEEQPKTLLMEPGDLVAVAHGKGTLTRQQVDPQATVVWQDNLLIFNEVTLADIAEKLRHAYGVEIIFRDSTLAQRRFKGFVPTDDIDLLLEAFTALYGMQIERDGDQLIFSGKK